MLRLPFWENLPYFHQVAQKGSLRQAANDLRSVLHTWFAFATFEHLSTFN